MLPLSRFICRSGIGISLSTQRLKRYRGRTWYTQVASQRSKKILPTVDVSSQLFWHVHTLTRICCGPTNDLPSRSWVTFDLIWMVDDDLDWQRRRSSSLGFFVPAYISSLFSIYLNACNISAMYTCTFSTYYHFITISFCTYLIFGVYVHHQEFLNKSRIFLSISKLLLVKTSRTRCLPRVILFPVCGYTS